MAASLKQQIDEFLGKLNPGTVVGLDIGAHSIKVCELSGGPGKYVVEKFGIYKLSEAAIIEDEIQKPEEVVKGILEAFDSAGIKSRIICLGLFGPNTMTKRLNVPEGSREEIEDHIMWEAEQYITFGADDSQIDFSILGKNEGGGNDALVVAAKSETVDNYINLLADSKISVKIVDLNVIAVCNIFEEIAGDKLEDYSIGTLIIDFGAQSTKVIIYKNGGPIFTKEIPIGGGLVTEEIQRQMGVNYEDAEDLKITTDEKGNLPDEILKIIDSQIDQQVAEIRKNVNFYVTQGSTEKVEYCFITGGHSLLPRLADKLVTAIGMPIEKLDISSTIKFNEKKIGDNIDYLNAVAASVIGLAMRKNG